MRIALANQPYPRSPDDAITLAVTAIANAGRAGAQIICFPECFVPGYRDPNHPVPPPDPAFLERAWRAIAEAAGAARVAVVLGTERVVDGKLLATALVIDDRGEPLAFQDKVQIDPRDAG